MTEQTPPPRPRTQHERIHGRDYEAAPSSYRPVWRLLLLLASMVAVVAVAAVVVDYFVLT